MCKTVPLLKAHVLVVDNGGTVQPSPLLLMHVPLPVGAGFVPEIVRRPLILPLAE